MPETHMDYLEQIAAADVDRLREKEKSYGGSWKRRGGVGAFMMLARKWDRIEERVSREYPVSQESPNKPTPAWDVFAHILHDDREEGVLADIQDLRCYLLLVEAEIRCQRAGDA